MISVIITAYKEPDTVVKTLKSIATQINSTDEILVTAPDEETLNAARELNLKNLILVKDQKKGKPAALNLAVSKAKGEILVLTDGDVYIGENSLKPLIAPFMDNSIGAVSGRPVSISPKKTKLGYWSFLLTEIAHQRRLKASRDKRRFFCSGYLFAIKKELFPKLKDEILSEDGFISHNVYNKGFKIYYSKESKVYVKYPDNFKDWIKQKRRSAGGYNQIRKMIGIEIRSFKKESFGAFAFFKYVKNFKDFYYLISLFIARVYLWFLIYKDINFKNKSHKEIWVRIESTK